MLIFDVALIFAGTLTALATIYIALQLSKLTHYYASEFEARKKERTLQAVQLHPSISITISRVLQEYDRSGPDAVMIYLQHDPAFKDQIYIALNALENLAIGIKQNLLDDDLAHARLGDLIPPFYHALKPFLYQSRRDYASASLFVQLEQLVRLWSDKKPYRQRDE